MALGVSSEQVVLNTEPLVNPQPLLVDLLTIDQSLSIFYAYARELELSKIFGQRDTNITLLAPNNKAITSLARKPCVWRPCFRLMH